MNALWCVVALLLAGAQASNKVSAPTQAFVHAQKYPSLRSSCTCNFSTALDSHFRANPDRLPIEIRYEWPLPPSRSLRPPNTSNRLLAEKVELWLSNLPEHPNNMFQSNEKYASVPLTPARGNPHHSHGRSRFRSWNFTPRKLLIVAAFIASLVFLNSLLSPLYHPAVKLTTSSPLWPY